MENISVNEYEFICEINLWQSKRPSMAINEVMQITLSPKGSAWISIDSYTEQDKYLTLEDAYKDKQTAENAFNGFVEQATARTVSIKRHMANGTTGELLRLQAESQKEGVLLY